MGMSENCWITINGKRMQVTAGANLAAALVAAGELSRMSVSGEARSPFCGMGICMECRATVNGRPQQRTCMLACTDGMDVVTG